MTYAHQTPPQWPRAHRADPPAAASDQARKRKKDAFVKGPVCVRWLARAVRLRKPALAAGLALWFLRGVTYNAGPYKITRAVRNRFQLSGPQMLRGLRALEGAKLVRFIKSGRGRCAVVDIIDLTPYRPNKRPTTTGSDDGMDLRDHPTAL